MERDSRKMRGERLFLFTDLREDVGLDGVIAWLEEKIGAPADSRRVLIDAHGPYVGHPHTHGHGEQEHGHVHEHNSEHGQARGHSH
jgi:urease accessory protein